MDYLEVLHRSWNIIWKHKVLWIFGIMAGCARGGGGGGGSGWSESRPYTGPGAPGFDQFANGAGEWIGTHLWIILVVGLAVLLMIALSIFLGTVGRIGVIRGTFVVDGGAEGLGFGKLWGESLRYFWRALGLALILGLPFIIIIVPLVVLGILTAGVGFLCILPLICLLVPLAWLAGIIMQQGSAAIVVDDLGLMDGLRRGWEMLKGHLGPLLIVWLITAVIGFVIGILIALPILVVAIPAAIALATSGGQSLPSAVLLVGGACLLIYLPVLIVANGILTAYIESVWTLTYLRLSRPKESTPSTPAIPTDA
jgi:hypothetical protein